MQSRTAAHRGSVHYLTLTAGARPSQAHVAAHVGRILRDLGCPIESLRLDGEELNFGQLIFWQLIFLVNTPDEGKNRSYCRPLGD